MLEIIRPPAYKMTRLYNIIKRRRRKKKEERPEKNSELQVHENQTLDLLSFRSDATGGSIASRVEI